MNYDTSMKLVDIYFDSEVIPGLSEFIKIDNLSPLYDPEWQTNGKLELAAKHCLDWANRQSIQGLKGEIIQVQGRTPLILFEIDPQGGDINILLYCHYDKQPHFKGWGEGLGPLNPVIRDGSLYGRGASDDGYAIFSIITAIKIIQTQGGKHGRVIIFVDGAEESGEEDLLYYLESLKERIGVPDFMICLDSGAQNYENLWVTTSLRGAADMELTVEVLEEPIHSGSGSGIAPSSFTIIRQLLDRLEDSKFSRVNERFHVEIPQNRIADAQKLAELLKSKIAYDRMKFLKGVEPLTNDFTELVLNNTWRPTLCVTGLEGLPSVKTAGNVLHASTAIRFSMRLPPTYPAEEAIDLIKEILLQDPPYNCKISVRPFYVGNGWSCKDLSEKLHKSLDMASQMIWGRTYYNYGEGGSIPFIKALSENYPKCEILVTGVLGPNSNAHSCNESLNINFCKGITAALGHIIADYSTC